MRSSDAQQHSAASSRNTKINITPRSPCKALSTPPYVSSQPTTHQHAFQGLLDTADDIPNYYAQLKKKKRAGEQSEQKNVAKCNIYFLKRLKKEKKSTKRKERNM